MNSLSAVENVKTMINWLETFKKCFISEGRFWKVEFCAPDRYIWLGIYAGSNCPKMSLIEHAFWSTQNLRIYIPHINCDVELWEYFQTNIHSAYTLWCWIVKIFLEIYIPHINCDIELWEYFQTNIHSAYTLGYWIVRIFWN